MGANSNKVLHVDTTTHPVYDTGVLNYFARILDDILEERGSTGILAHHEREYLKAQLATAIFRSAAGGERDYARLKQDAIEAVSVPSSDRGA